MATLPLDIHRPTSSAACPLVASGFAVRKVGRPLFGLAMMVPVYHALIVLPQHRRLNDIVAADVVAHIPAAVRTECMFIYQGATAYYRLTDACLPTRYPFAAHLSSRREGPSLGVDPHAELGRIMARRPAVVLTVEHLRWPDRDLGMERRLAAYLARDYVLGARMPYGSYSSRERLLVWRRADLAPS